MPEPQALVLLDQPGAHDQRDDADGHVDEEDPVPVDELGQDAAGQKAKGAAAGDHEREDAHRLGALAGLLETGDEDRQDDAGGEGSAEALSEARRDQLRRPVGHPAGNGGHREEEDPSQEHLPAADQVTHPPGDQQEASIGDQVRVDDPGQLRLAEPEVRLDRRQGHVHDRGVEHDHQLPEADDDAGLSSGVDSNSCGLPMNNAGGTITITGCMMILIAWIIWEVGIVLIE